MPNGVKGKNSWFSMEMEAGQTTAHVYIYDAIGYWEITADDFRKQLDGLGDVEHIHLHINCPGGSVFDGTAIYNLLKNHPASVETTIEGLAASMGSVIALAGNPVRIAENGYYMIHDPSTIARGNEKDLNRALKLLKTVKATMVSLYTERSGMSTDEVVEAMTEETWYSGKEAVEAGFCDEVSGAEDVAASFDLSAFGNVPESLSQQISKPSAKADQIKLSEGKSMNDKVKKKPNGEEPSANGEGSDVKGAVAEGIKDFKAEEKNRREGVRAAFEGFDFEGQAALMQSCLDDMDCSIDDAGAKILDHLKQQNSTTQPTHSNMGVVSAGGGREKMMADAENAVLMRMGVETESTENNGFKGFSLMDLARAFLQSHGFHHYNGRMELVGSAFTHQSGDFPALLGNIAKKAMLKGYEEADEIFEQFTTKGTLTDFKPLQRVDLGVFPSLRKVPEGAEYKHVTLDERAEQAVLASFGELFSITRQAVINDDLNAFTRLPRKFGGAARRTVGDLVFSILLDNPKMGDGAALFHLSHKNIAAAGLITSESLEKAVAMMGLQKMGKAALNIRPEFLLTGITDQGRAKSVVEAEHEYLDTDKDSRRPNAVRNVAKPLSDARLEDADAAFLLSNPNVHDGIEVMYLDGNSEPRMEQQAGWNVDGVEFKVAIDAAAKAWDWRTMVKMPKS